MAIGISMVLLSQDTSISAEKFVEQLKQLAPELPQPEELEYSDEMISMQVGQHNIVMAKMPAPIPWSELEGPCATSMLWKNAAEEVKKHVVHWIVTVNGELEPIPLASLLTQTTAAAMIACESAIGVYWGNSTMVIPKNIFVEFTREILPQGPPLHIWVDFRVGKDSDASSSGFTAGMAALGHREFEADSCPEPPNELYDRFMSLASYVLENGPVIRDGDTIGEDAEERIRVVYAKSSYGHEGKVMKLKYETQSATKPWWKLW